MRNNNDIELINSYILGTFMLSLLDEWSKIERLGAVAKIHNTITKKHNVFDAQIFDFNRGKKKKISHKCSLFIEAGKIANKAWQSVINDIDENIAISANVVIHNLYRLNSSKIEKIYGLKEEDFISLTKFNTNGVIFTSCKIARLLSEKVELLLNEED